MSIQGLRWESVLCLAIDTSTPDLIVGVVQRAEHRTTLIAETIIEDSRAHNEQLTPTTVAVLEEAGVTFAEFDRVVVGCGPGPFTGLRVGMATGAAFGDALGIPVVGVCSHDAIAAQIVEGAEDGVLVATDARRKEIYYTTYQGAERSFGPEVVKPESLDLAHHVSTIAIPEQLWEKLPEAITADAAARRVDLKPLPQYLVQVATDAGLLDNEHPAPLEPLYLRRPDAKEPKAKPRSSAIPEVQI